VVVNPTAEAGMPYLTLGLQDAVTASYPPESNSIEISLMNAIVVVYLAGVLFMLGRIFTQLVFLQKLKRHALVEEREHSRIYFHTGSISHFSLFNRVFLNRHLIHEQNEDLKSILAHERVHIRQWHSIDMLVAELTSVILWFNPLVWIYRSMIQEVHEYIADSEVVNTTRNMAEYQALLVNQALGVPVFSITNKFNQVQLKKRINMLHKIKTSGIAHLKALTIIPLVLGVLVLSAWGNPSKKNMEQRIKITGKVIASETGKPLSGAVVIIQNTTEGTVTDVQGEFVIESPEKASLVFTFVGYTSQIIAASAKSPLLIKMERSVVALEGSQVNSEVTDVPVEKQPLNQSEKNVVYVVDGVVTDASEIRTLAPERILSVDVLKGENALKAYGEKGRNGVIQIVTIQQDPQKEGSSENPDSIKNAGEVYQVVEQMPEFAGGIEKFREFISASLVYPKEAVSARMEGKVFVSFTVDEQGFIKDIKVVRGVSPVLDAEAIRAVGTSPRWKPGVQKGKTLSVNFTMPVMFSLPARSEGKDAKPLSIAEEMPVFNGKDLSEFGNWVAGQLKYPAEAKDKKIQGKVFVSFVVNAEGYVENAKVVRGASPLLDAEALRVIRSSPVWNPGKNSNKPVPVEMTMPVNFSLK
jgi:TonB family protein